MFKPTYVFDKVGEITPDFLAKKHIKGLLLDLDNTLTTHNNPIPPQSSLDWLAKMKAAGIKLMIVSNNHAPRVKPFAEQLELDFVPEGKKPLTFGYTKAIAKLGLNKKNVAAVGDQIGTYVQTLEVRTDDSTILIHHTATNIVLNLLCTIYNICHQMDTVHKYR